MSFIGSSTTCSKNGMNILLTSYMLIGTLFFQVANICLYWLIARFAKSANVTSVSFISCSAILNKDGGIDTFSIKNCSINSICVFVNGVSFGTIVLPDLPTTSSCKTIPGTNLETSISIGSHPYLTIVYSSSFVGFSSSSNSASSFVSSSVSNSSSSDTNSASSTSSSTIVATVATSSSS